MASLLEKRREELARIGQLHSSEIDPHPDFHGVLLSDEITFYANNHGLISPFSPENLKPAAYELTIGNEYFIDGEYLPLDNGNKNLNSKIEIPPFQVAVIKTAETLCIPRYMIARWNIKVSHAYLGLLWVGGPQVDPGYKGHLFCPLYNLSDKTVTLHMGETIAVIDFVKTTPFDASKSKNLVIYPSLPKRPILQDFGINDLRSALFTKAGQRITEFDSDIKNLETRFTTFTQISLTVFSFVLASIATISKIGAENATLSASFFGAITIALSVFAVLTSILSYVQKSAGRLIDNSKGYIPDTIVKTVLRHFRRAWWIGIIVSLCVVSLIGFGVYRSVTDRFEDIQNKNTTTVQDLLSSKTDLTNKLDQTSQRLDSMERDNSAMKSELEAFKASQVKQSKQKQKNSSAHQ